MGDAPVPQSAGQQSSIFSLSVRGCHSATSAPSPAFGEQDPPCSGPGQGSAGATLCPPPGWGGGDSRGRSGLFQKPRGGGLQPEVVQVGCTRQEGGRLVKRGVAAESFPRGAGRQQSPSLERVTWAGNPSWNEQLGQDFRWGGDGPGGVRPPSQSPGLSRGPCRPHRVLCHLSSLTSASLASPHNFSVCLSPG